MTGASVVYDVGSWRLGDDGSIFRRGRLKYSNGDVYDGEWLNGKRHGKGLLRFAASSGGGSYVGDFAENFFHGFGLLTVGKSQHPLTKQWLPGERYEGDFVIGRRHGKGAAKTRSRDVYDGEWVDGCYHGKGSCAYANGDVYDGEWVHGKWQGRGELRLRGGSRYTGEFRQGMYHGFGELLFGSGGKLGSYVGDFVDGKRRGKGVRVYGADKGKRYEGEWEDDEPHGVGVVECATFKLVGRFVRGKESGHGAVSFANGESYEGNFDDGHMSGHGTFVYRDGGTYEGQFEQSKRHGHGRRVFGNGDEYVGAWEDDCMHGRGKLTSVHELRKGRGTQVYDGAFERGAQTGSAAISYVYTPHDAASRFEWTDEYEFPRQSGFWHCGRGASTYVGEVVRGAFHGSGELRSPDGKLWAGEWVHGKLSGVGERVFFPLELAAVLDREKHRSSNSNAGPTRESDNAKKHEALHPSSTKLYRILWYAGGFLENVRHGSGHLLYENGDRVSGSFVKGFVHGVAWYRFAGSGKDRYADFRHGQRTRWLAPDEEDAVRAHEAAKALAREAESSRQNCVIRALIA
ncbi:hypothetical protein PybrP1_008667 [[Pythium] brassicae (nom. inval.)]|nr:hypothetical protein PybrP1_008667 [[Pythium] brassicae (nom. inval.)]